MNNPFLQQNIVDCCRLLAVYVGCVAAASREKRAKNKASFRFLSRMTMAAMLGQHRRRRRRR